MTNKNLGTIGEMEAYEYLVKLGYTILEKNWRYHKAEIDLIAKLKDTLVFVEVKTRTSDRHGKPEWMVSRKQQKEISYAAKAYMRKVNHEWLVRFDVIGILANQKSNVLRLTHLKDAYFDP